MLTKEIMVILICVDKCRLFISLTNPWLAARPVDTVHNISRFGTLNPYNAREKELWLKLAGTQTFCLENRDIHFQTENETRLFLSSSMHVDRAGKTAEVGAFFPDWQCPPHRISSFTPFHRSCVQSWQLSLVVVSIRLETV